MNCMRKVVRLPALLLVLPATACSVPNALSLVSDLRPGDVILKGLGIILSAVSSIYVVPKLRQKTKAGLKTDLEILKLMKETDHPKQSEVRDQISARADAIYSKQVGRLGLLPPVKNPGIFIAGIVGVPAFLISSMRLWPNHWAFLTGFLAFASFGWIMIGFEEPRKRE